MPVTGPDFIALQVRDLERSAAFYEQHLGLVRQPGPLPEAREIGHVSVDAAGVLPVTAAATTFGKATTVAVSATRDGAASRGDFAVRVMVCHWSRTRPVFRQIGQSRLGA